ncbi:protein kinase [Calothrix sp. NIES-2100]|uniref:serine/threonine-protein kinase n=1 Tax=Calothrix sp. NIES-2100 TaxID=1954172 RepID=UPI000B61D567|nr:protein kinase [Calothrix sp. NIES-2100]
MVLNPGQQLFGGRYIIERKLGEGGVGITYLVKNRSGELRVIKTLREKILNDPAWIPYQDQLKQNFKDEAFQLALCRHPHIVEVENVFYEDDLPFIAMEYIRGEALKSWITLPENEALLYIRQIGDALTLMHERGLLHRDVKPSNIIIRQGKKAAVLIDFGLARQIILDKIQKDIATSSDSYVPPTATSSDIYAPPEHYIPDAELGEYIDVYALAATLYTWLTGNLPFSASYRSENNISLKSPQEINPNVSDSVNNGIMRGMALNYKFRPQSVQEWLELVDPKLEIQSLKSAVGIDYTKLRDLLVDGKWEQANQETIDRVAQTLVGGTYFSIPCEDINIIDKLWVKYSSGRFGFSVQKRIYHSLGGTKECYYFDDEYLEHIGWQKDGSLQLCFDITAPVAHLPCYTLHWYGTSLHPWYDISFLSKIFTRLDNCPLPIHKSHQVASVDIKLTLPTGLEYTRLITLLVSQDWQAADLETQKLMFGSSLGLMDMGGNAYQQMQKFSSEHLQILDRLWVKYSNGRYGFSVQRDIWSRVNGHVGDFARAIGWVSNDMYRGDTAIFYEDVNFSLAAPIGHLPCFMGNFYESGDTQFIGHSKTYIFLVDFGTNNGIFENLTSHGHRSNPLLSQKERMEYVSNHEGNYDEKLLYLDVFFKLLK